MLRMDEEFWQSRWRADKIGFHEGQVNQRLLRYFQHLDLTEGDTVFVPLCGKTVDLDWLVSKRLNVVGIEFHEPAVAEVFSRQNLVPVVTRDGPMVRYQTKHINLFVGDLFDLNPAWLGKIDAVYDRAALVALPADTRAKYASHVSRVTNRAQQLLLTFGKDGAHQSGPPFSVSCEEVQKIYGNFYKFESLDSRKGSDTFSERDEDNDDTWLLRPL